MKQNITLHVLLECVCYRYVQLMYDLPAEGSNHVIFYSTDDMVNNLITSYLSLIFIHYSICLVLYSLYCAEVPLRNCSLTHSLTQDNMASSHIDVPTLLHDPEIHRVDSSVQEQHTKCSLSEAKDWLGMGDMVITVRVKIVSVKTVRQKRSR